MVVAWVQSLVGELRSCRLNGLHTHPPTHVRTCTHTHRSNYRCPSVPDMLFVPPAGTQMVTWVASLSQGLPPTKPRLWLLRSAPVYCAGDRQSRALRVACFWSWGPGLGGDAAKLKEGMTSFDEQSPARGDVSAEGSGVWVMGTPSSSPDMAFTIGVRLSFGENKTKTPDSFSSGV